jgi:PhnB protein
VTSDSSKATADVRDSLDRMTNALRPKLVTNDAAGALRWYADVLDAEVGQRYEAGGRIVFAELVLLGTAVTLKDSDSADPAPQPGPILDCVVDDPDGLAARMVDAGGAVVFPVADQPYGARGGRVLDPFGVQWLLQTPLSMSPEEVQESLEGPSRA